MRRTLGSIAGLTCIDFLNYFHAYGMPDDSRATKLATEATTANANPHFLVYWYLEGGWCGYDMFNPVNTENNVVNRLENIPMNDIESLTGAKMIGQSKRMARYVMATWLNRGKICLRTWLS